jgi:hypothetical protein
MLNASFYDVGRTTLLILPLLSMHEEYQARATSHDLSVETWTFSSSAHHPPQIVLVAAEKCTWDSLLIYILTLLHKGRLARIVVDEAHLLLKHDSFRPCVNFLKFFGTLPLAIVLLTATCPPCLEKDLFRKVGREVYRVLRQGTDRPEISQKMDRIVLDHARELEDVVAENVLALQSELVGKERMLLFCLSHKDCDRMAELLHWKAYHSHISLEDRSAHMMLWKEGSIKGLACTSMLNCCLDYSTVRYVFHLEAPRDVVDYYQAIGRCARDGKLGTAIVYYTPCRGGRESTKDDPFGKSVLWEMLHGRTVNQCRRVSPSEFLDGFGIPCTMLPDANFCDVCSDAMASATHAGGWSHSSSSPIMPLTMSPRSFVTTTPPPASFGTHLVAALSSLKPVQPSQEEQLGLMIRQACDVLSNHCVCCWVLKLKTECTSHRLIDCERFKSTASEFSQWMDDLVLPMGCCFYCGGPQKARNFFLPPARAESSHTC